MFEGVGNRSAQPTELTVDEFPADSPGRQYFRDIAMPAVHRNREADGAGQIALHAFEDPVEELGRGRGFGGPVAWLEERSRHGLSHSFVTTVATRSNPEIPRSVLICPVCRTSMVSCVVAASANNARTAALSQ